MSTAQIAEVVSIRPQDDSLDFEGIPANVNEVIAPISQLVVTRRVGGVLLVYLLHKTVKEFLTSDTLAASPAKGFYVDVGTAHARLGDLCLQYLSFSDFDVDLPRDPGKAICGKHGVIRPKVALSDDEKVSAPPPLQTLPGAIRRYWLYPYAALHLVKHLMISEQNSTQLETDQRRLQGFWGDQNERKRKLRARVCTLLGGTDAVINEPIYYAIFAHLHRFMDILLPLQTDLNQHFEDGMTCLTAAALHNNIEAATKLLDLGADVNQATTDRKKRLTPLHLAAESGHEQMVDLLISAGANIHLQSAAKTTAFYRAARGGSTRILRRLHELGSEVDAPSWDGWTPLMEAIEKQRFEAVPCLLELGANPQSQTQYGETPLSLAKGFSHSAPTWMESVYEGLSQTVWWKILRAVETALEAWQQKELETAMPSSPHDRGAAAMSLENMNQDQVFVWSHNSSVSAAVSEKSAMPALVGDALGSRSLPPNKPEDATLVAKSGSVYAPTDIEMQDAPSP